MSLQVLRTVLKNEINEVSVCTDVKREDGGLYTVISIVDADIRRELAKRVNSERIFTENRDFVGSFTYQNSFNLVFVYRQEARLCDREALVARNFADRKKLAGSLLAACAETGAEGPIGELLLHDRNIQVTSSGKVYFNYFLDFRDFQPDAKPNRFFTLAADFVFEVLAREYSVKFNRNVDYYPQELQAFFKKKQRGAFTGFSQILTAIREMPDEPRERHYGILRIWDHIRDVASWVRRHSMTLFITLLVGVTLIYAGHQIYLRATYKKAREMNTSYVGMDVIGEVYLGDEDI